MFVQIQFPFADLRPFVDADVGRLPVPEWPEPGRDGRGFLRGFGPVTWRPRGGLPGWVLEEFICEIRSIRLAPRADAQATPQAKFLFCRFFHDGTCVTKVDLGLFVRDAAKDDLRAQLQSDPKLLASHVRELFKLNLHHSHTGKETSVGAFAAFLKRQYVYATTSLNRKTGKIYDFDQAARFVDDGPPVVYVEFGPPAAEAAASRKILDRYQELPHKTYVRFSGADIGPERLPVWSVIEGGEADDAARRRLRLALTRVHTEIFCLRAVLSRIESGIVAPTQGGQASNRLQDYLKQVKKRIDLNAVLKDESADGLMDMAAAYGRWRPAYVGSLLDKLASLNLRRNIYLDTAKILPALDPDAVRQFLGDKQLVVIAKEFVMQKKIEAGQIGVYNESGSVTVGNITQTSTTTITQNFDPAALAAELAKAIDAARTNAKTAAEFTETAALAQAKEAADKGDKDGVLSALKAAGKWTLDLAQKVGASILTEIVKKQIGL